MKQRIWWADEKWAIVLERLIERMSVQIYVASTSLVAFVLLKDGQVFRGGSKRALSNEVFGKMLMDLR